MYDFETTDFALSQAGIHLLKSRFNYKTIAYNDIDTAVIRKGIEAKRPLLSLAVGIAFTAVAMYVLARVYALFRNPATKLIYIEHILLPLFPLAVGIYPSICCLQKRTCLDS